MLILFEDPYKLLFPHSYRTPAQFSSPPYTPPHQMQRSFSSPDNLQKHAMVSFYFKKTILYCHTVALP